MRIRTAVLGLFGAVLVACGGDEAVNTPGPNLKDGVHLLPNPQSGFVVFPMTLVNSEATQSVTLYAGGKQPVMLTDICLETPDQARADDYEPCAAPVTDASISLTLPESDEVAPGSVAAIGVTFSPKERGVKVLRLVVLNTSENLPDMSFEIVGPGAAFPLPTGPDIVPFESTVRFDTDDGAGGALGFVRYYNLGAGLLVVSNYTVSGDGFALQTGVLTPSEACADLACNEPLTAACEPVVVGTGASRVLGLRASASASEGSFTIRSSDPDTCELSITLRKD